MESNRSPASCLKSVLNCKKPAFWIILVVLLAGVVVAVCLLTVPEKSKPGASLEATPAPVPFTGVMEWFDARSESRESLAKKAVYSVNAFPDVVFLWKDGSWGDPIQAVENGKARTLFTGMPIQSVYFADVTGDGKPELCATVSFGSGWVDDHIVVYDYANKQSYTLWDRFQFDFHLSIVDGALLVDKTLCNSYSSDTCALDTGTLVMHDGVLSCQWQSDGSFTPLNRELHESELLGEWLVEEERDRDGNVLYSFALDLWKEYNFREDGTVTYNETVPISSDYDLAFGHPVDYPYAVYDNSVQIGDNADGSYYGYGHLDENGRLQLSVQVGANEYVYATLRRMGEDAPVS